MKIRHRLSLQFTWLSGIILSIAFLLIYLLSANSVQNSFYKLLQMRALVTAQVYLEKDELTKKKFLEIEKSYREKIPDESGNIYDQYNRPVFIEQIKYDWPASLLETIRKKDVYRFRHGDVLGLGIYYPDNQGDFVVIVTAKNVLGEQQLSYLRWMLLIMLLIALAITYFMGQWYATKALTPINRINRQVRKIRSNNLHMRVEPGNNKDEINELATNFNGLLQHMEQAFELQRTFVSNASHELRTPLTTIIGEIEVTLQNSRQPDYYVQTLNTLLGESEKLKVITDSLLQLTTIDTILTHTNSEKIRLDELLWELQIQWSTSSPSGKLKIKLPDLPADENMLCISGNRRLLTLALQNIIRNSFKFSHYQEVTALLTCSKDGIVLSISDKGIGIAMEDLENIFLPLYRAENAHSFEGHGIGLSMTRKIMQIHQAVITASSVVGQGTTFNIFFPRYPKF
ncbi:sensor histidine kinase [Chitinophaga silvatica]|uniref:histidine kinase n=1 Tax=Chitinophaga silvatica TaxID=2282649 RepID=A0A3E1YHZ1_9BACT|nr:HAMP domain-containing sensor histidine kinase [Chitinophaga silvatica]RFS26860.1 sensor histidine kinase [Chitinophaga silvatica]